MPVLRHGVSLAVAEKDLDEEHHGDDADAADLDQNQNDSLPERRPVRRGVLHDKTRHAHRGRGREQRVKP